MPLGEMEERIGVRKPTAEVYVLDTSVAGCPLDKKYRLGRQFIEEKFCRQIRGKDGKQVFLKEKYVLNTKILFTKLSSAVLSLKSSFKSSA